MTIAEIFAYTEAQYPNQYGDDLKMTWLNQVEKDIIDYIELFDDGVEYRPHESDTEEVVIEEPDIYALYIAAKADFANGEYSRYNNKVALFNSMFDDWKGRYMRHHRPLMGRYIKL